MEDFILHSLKIADLSAKIIGGLSALIIFIIGFKRYKKDQDWKKKEFVAKEIDNFDKNPFVKNAKLMLDWGKRDIELYPDNPEYSKRFASIGRSDLAKALIPHKNIGRKFNNDETAIRDTFDCFLEHLTRFEHFNESGLVGEAEFYPYLRYWIDLIGNKLPDLPRSSLYYFIHDYGYTEIETFLNRFDIQLKPPKTIEELLFELGET